MSSFFSSLTKKSATKKLLCLAGAAMLTVGLLGGCGSGTSSGEPQKVLRVGSETTSLLSNLRKAIHT